VFFQEIPNPTLSKIYILYSPSSIRLEIILLFREICLETLFFWHQETERIITIQHDLYRIFSYIDMPGDSFFLFIEKYA